MSSPSSKLEWYGFTIQLELPNMPPRATNLIAGYQLDELGGLHKVMVTKQTGRSVEWKYIISEPDEKVAVLPETGELTRTPKPIIKSALIDETKSQQEQFDIDS